MTSVLHKPSNRVCTSERGIFETAICQKTQRVLSSVASEAVCVVNLCIPCKIGQGGSLVAFSDTYTAPCECLTPSFTPSRSASCHPCFKLRFHTGRTCCRNALRVV